MEERASSARARAQGAVPTSMRQVVWGGLRALCSAVTVRDPS